MFKKFINILLLLLMTLNMAFLTSCSVKEEEEEANPDQFLFDPRQPGKDNDDISVRGLQNLEIDKSVTGKVSFTWDVIPLYNTLDYTIEIYRKRAEGSDDDYIPLDPSNNDTTAFLYVKESGYKSNQWVDEDVLPDASYIYFFYVKIDTFWSKDEPLLVVTDPTVDEFILPNPDEFWQYDKLVPYGQNTLTPDGVAQEFYFLQSLKIGDASIGDSRGSVGVAFDGAIMYVPDTNTNRIVIYARAQGRAIECVNNAGDDEEELIACQLQFSNQPLEAYNVLGQPEVDTFYSCDDPEALPMNECLEQPTHAVVEGDKLFISERGNDRVVVWNHLPINGCDPTPFSDGTSRPIDCTPDSVIGKPTLFSKNLNPQTGQPLSLAIDGKAMLCNPGAVKVYKGDLFIPDTCHHRIVTVQAFEDINSYDCNDENWLTELCSFHSVLGQPDFNTVETFEDLYNANNGLLGGPLNRTISDPDLLKRKFANPNRIRLTDENKMMVSVNENFTASSTIGTTVSIKGRILMFDPEILRGFSPSCNLVSFTNNGCDVEKMFGIEDSENIILISSASGGAGSYSSISYSLENVADFDVDGELLMAVDSIHNFIYVWDNWKTESRLGTPYKYRITNPNGAVDPITQRNLPILKSLSGIEIDMTDNSVYVVDAGGNRVYRVVAEDSLDISEIFGP